MIPSSRDAVLARIRSALGATPRTDAARAELDARITSPPRWTRLAVEDDIVARFIAKARANLSEVQPVASLQELGSAVEAILAERGETRNISIAPTLREVSWPANWMINFGKGRVSEKVSITDALAGVAETGSLIFASATDRPTSLNFLPELHLAVLRKADIVANFEDAWPRLRALGIWPRTVNIISAASRTADVAQIIVRPAHGPKLLHIMLLESG